MHSAAARGTKSRRACGACGSLSTTICHHQRFIVPDGYPLPAKYDVVICNRRDFVYADSDATQHDYDRFYCEWSKYDDSATASGSGVSPYDAARLSTTADDIARALPSLHASLLDAGCATGGLLTALRDRGFTSVAGLDPSARCAGACRDRGFPAYVGSISTASTLAHVPKFDCVVFSHVLEPVHDIPGFFTAARSLIVSGGYIYLETPDATRYDDYLYARFEEFNTEHINHFSARSLENTARRFGFQPTVLEQKVFPTAEDTRYPAVFGLFRDTITSSETKSVVRDPELPSQIASYIRHSEDLIENISSHLETKLAHLDQVIFWGAGQFAMKLLTLPCFAHTRVRALVDNNPILRGKRLAGAPVVGPAEIAGTDEPIVIATLLHAGEIRDQIMRLGLRNPIISLLPNSSPAHSKTTSGAHSQ
jgi:2-polyprenyl-3-methyl-5-hydroxy-6-metoxy-1,4-benzoquinol methylase